jgi:putative tricarboxylic transport membrane protein
MNAYPEGDLMRKDGAMMLRILVVLLAFGIGLPLTVAAQGFKPTRPVEVVVHTGPGGGNDVLARAIATIVEKEKLLSVRMQVVNKTGGGGLTAMAYLVEKKGESHSIALFANTWFTVPVITAEAKVTMNDLTPIARLVVEPAVVAVKNDVPYKSLKDFIDAAKASPGQLKQSGGSIGSRDWVMHQLLMKHTGANWVFISFPGGGERIAALLGGHVNMMIIEAQEAGEHIRSGNMRVLAQIADRRLPPFPDVPTLREAGFDVPAYAVVRGVVGPPGMAPDAVAYWADFFARMTQTASWKKYKEDNLFEEGFQKGPELAKFMKQFPEQIRGILRDAGVKVVR